MRFMLLQLKKWGGGIEKNQRMHKKKKEGRRKGLICLFDIIPTPLKKKKKKMTSPVSADEEVSVCVEGKRSDIK